MADDAVTWAQFERADEALAQRVMARLGCHRHAIMATLKADGSPRVSGMEAPIRSGNLWLGMTPGSRKAVDLRRDPRFSLHSAPDAENLANGDARIDGIAQLADAAEQDEFVAGHRHSIDDPSLMVLYVAMITRVVLIRVSADSLLIESWTPATGRREQRIQ